MKLPRKGYGVSAALAFVMLVVTACSGSQPTASEQRAATPTVVATETSQPTVTLPTEEPTAVEPTLVEPTPEQPQFNELAVTLDYKAGRAPKSVKRSGIIDGPGYTQAVMVSFRDVWRTAFANTQYSAPRLTYDITSFGDVYKSKCANGGKPIVITPQTTAMLYCVRDSKPDGAIAIPLDSMAAIWKKSSPKVGDLSVAVSMTRQASLITVTALERQFAMTVPSELGRQYVSACLSGAWAHAVYAQGAFTDKEIATALEYSFAIPTIGDRTTASIANDSQAVTAWVVGFRGGQVAECGRNFWK